MIFAGLVGFYRIENGHINGRVFYSHNNYSCWWFQDSWMIGNYEKQGSGECFAYLPRDIPCLHDIDNQYDWQIAIQESDEFMNAEKTIGIFNGPDTGT